MNAVAIYRFGRHGSVAVRNQDHRIDARGLTSRALASRDELVAVAEERFGIPAEIVAEAVGELRDLQDAWA
jgi:hypothetical protein